MKPGRKKTMYFFGTMDGQGPDLWSADGSLVLPMYSTTGNAWRRNDGEIFSLPWDMIDCVLCPGEREPRECDNHGDVRRENQREGEYALHHKDGWTALAWWDRSDDERFWSNSVLFAKGKLSAAEMLAYANERFPGVMKRITYRFTEGKFVTLTGDGFRAPKYHNVDAVETAKRNIGKRVDRRRGRAVLA